MKQNNKQLLISVCGITIIGGVYYLAYLAHKKMSFQKKNQNLKASQARNQEKKELIQREQILEILEQIHEKSRDEMAGIIMGCRENRRKLNANSIEYKQCVKEHQQ